MSSLFSIFDPSAFLGLPLNWISVILIGLILPTSFWICSSQVKKTLTTILTFLKNEFNSITGLNALPGMVFPSVAVFMFIWLNNFLGLSPYVFTATSHLTLSLALALPLWLGHVAYSWVKTPMNMFAHLVPLGSPAALSPFMVMIELVSAIIRPITLSVRLAANMVAGHLLMVLLSSPLVELNLAFMAIVLMALVALAVLETAVATIQAYVFSILTVLYVNEVQSDDLI